MSANIFGARFLSVRKPAWHNIGKVLENAPDTVAEAYRTSGMDYKFITSEVFANVPTGGRPVKMPIENRVALLREPTTDDPEWRSLGIVSTDYQPIQNMELADLLDDLGLAKKWQLETVGALGVGDRIFTTFKVGNHNVLGLDSEELDLYFLVTESRGNAEALKISFTPVRVVCQNTLELGLAEALTTVRIPHVRGADVQIKDRVKVMAGMDQSIDSTLQLFDKLAAFGVTESTALSIIAKAYPQPVKPKRLRDAEQISAMPEYLQTDVTGLNLSTMWATDTLSDVGNLWTRECGRIEGLRSQALDLFHRFNDEQPQVANTGWAVVNAVVENEDFRDGPEGLYASTLWGARAKTKAAALKATVSLM